MSDLSKKIRSNGINRLDFLKNSALAVGGGLVGSRMMIDSETMGTPLPETGKR